VHVHVGPSVADPQDMQPQHDRSLTEESWKEKTEQALVVHGNEKVSQREQDVGESIEREPVPKQTREKPGPENENTERQEPESPEYLGDHMPVSMEVKEEQGDGVELHAREVRHRASALTPHSESGNEIQDPLETWRLSRLDARVPSLQISAEPRAAPRVQPAAVAPKSVASVDDRKVLRVKVSSAAPACSSLGTVWRITERRSQEDQRVLS